MTALLLALLAGTLTTLSPCVLPVLPIVLVGALASHRLAPLALAAGLASAFAAFGTVITWAGFSSPHSREWIRYAAAATMLAFGMAIVLPALQHRIGQWSAPLSALLQDATSRFVPSGLAGQFMLGALLGAIWTPCSGPTLGAAIGLAAASESMARAGAIMLAFALGASLPLMGLAYGSRQALLVRRSGLARFARAARPALGFVVATMGIVIALGWDRRMESALADWLPESLLDIATRF